MIKTTLQFQKEIWNIQHNSISDLVSWKNWQHNSITVGPVVKTLSISYPPLSILHEDEDTEQESKPTSRHVLTSFL